ncbi:transposable element Tcb1 transposase [Trichonephila clavipes]|nr:transposable element Tcb1 transposase [Trichonephila clavipes]
MLGRRIEARQPPPTCLPELRRALLDEWCNISQDQIDNLILSMPRRYNMLTKYQMIKFIDFCEMWFLPELVARVGAIVGDHHCHTLRH